MKTISACTLDCPDACSLLIERDRQGGISISGNPEHPFTAGIVCKKIHSFPKRLTSPNRILEPLLREGAAWKAISWDAALDLCAEKIQKYRKEPSSILHLWAGGYKGILHMAPALFFGELGASTGRGSLCNAAGNAACKADFGAGDTNDPLDLLKAGGIANWGRDFSRCSVHQAALVRRARTAGARVLTISPGGDENGTFSDEIIRIRPGTDRYLAAAVMGLFIERGQVRESIIEHTDNWPAFKAVVENSSFDEMIGGCGVSREDVQSIFEFYSQPAPVATLIGWGLQRYLFGGENVRFINALALLSGNIGISGGGTSFTFSSVRNFNRSWATPSNKAPRRSFPMPVMGREITDSVDPPIRMAWVNCCNIINQAPDSALTAKAFESIEFKVVVDAFMNDTAERADLVLPCALMLEKEDIVGSSLHNYVNYAGKVTDPPGEARTDFWIVSELGKRLDPPILMPEMEECLRSSLDSPFLETSLEELRTKGFVQAKRGAIAFEGMKLGHKDGKYRFPEGLSPEPPAPAGYPLRLLTLIRKEAIHSQILPEDHNLLPTVRISSNNPMLAAIDTNRDVFLASPLGRIKVRVEPEPDLHPDVVVYRRGDWMKSGGGVNQIIESKMTDIGQGAAYYAQYVRLEN